MTPLRPWRRLLLALALAASGAFAGDRPARADIAQIQRVIHRQIEAFRSVSVQFRDPLSVKDDVMQEVLLADGAGNVTTAYFVVQRQRDGSWRISGCVLAKSALIWT